MKLSVKTISALCICLCLMGLSVLGQSGKGRNKASKKTNKRNTIESNKENVSSKDKPKFSNLENREVIEMIQEGDDDEIRIDTSLVTIPVRVLDRDGRFISGLEQKDFKVFEDKTEQNIAYFSNEQKPFTVALVLDMSYSTTFKIDEIQQAALQFVKELRPADQVMVFSFDEELHVLCEPTNDRKVINSAIIKTQISTGTSLYEAVDFVINKRLNKIEGRKAIVLFTDGVDTTSRKINNIRNLRDASELDALVYPIRYDTFDDVQAIENGKIKIQDPNKIPQTTTPIGGGTIPTSRNKSQIPILIPNVKIGSGTQSRSIPNGSGTTIEEYKLAEEYLEQMARRTGGRVYQATSAGTLTRAFSKIASELREFYSIGYYPDENKETEKKRRIKVRVNRKKVAVKSRSSYIVKKKAKSK